MKAIRISIQSILCLIALIMVASNLQAQQVPMLNQYYRARTLAYPSASVFNLNPKLSLVYREQFSGLEGAPTGVALAYSGSMAERMGFGANLTSNNVGLIQQIRVQGGIGYKFLDANGHRLAIGTQLTYSSFSINDDLVSAESFNDPILSNLIGSNGSTFSVDFSLSYRFSEFQLDFAAPTLINQSLSDDEYIKINEDNIPDYLMGLQYSFLIDAEKQIFLRPNLTWRYREVIGSEFDALARVDFNDKFSLFGGYRGNYGASVGAGIFISKNIEFTYNQDFGDPEIPFLNDGFSEFGLHLTMKSADKKNASKYKTGEVVYNKVIDENIYDESLLNSDDKSALKEYLYSLETVGNKKERRAKAGERYTQLFESLRAQEVSRLQALAQTRRQAEQDSINALNTEQARLESERLEQERLAEEQRREDERKAKEAEQAKQDKISDYERATLLAIEKLSKPEQERIKAINRLVLPDRLTELGAPGEPNFANSVKAAYIIVVAAYDLDSRASRVYLNSILGEYANAKIFASRKRGYDYVFIGQSNDYEDAIAKMRAMKENTQFKDSWVHIVRLSELEGN